MHLGLCRLLDQRLGPNQSLPRRAGQQQAFEKRGRLEAARAGLISSPLSLERIVQCRCPFLAMRELAQKKWQFMTRYPSDCRTQIQAVVAAELVQNEGPRTY